MSHPSPQSDFLSLPVFYSSLSVSQVITFPSCSAPPFFRVPALLRVLAAVIFEVFKAKVRGTRILLVRDFNSLQSSVSLANPMKQTADDYLQNSLLILSPSESPHHRASAAFIQLELPTSNLSCTHTLFAQKPLAHHCSLGSDLVLTRLAKGTPYKTTTITWPSVSISCRELIYLV